MKESILNIMAKEALRTIAVGYKDMSMKQFKKVIENENND